MIDAFMVQAEASYGVLALSELFKLFTGKRKNPDLIFISDLSSA
jgi:hypothetical protein